MYQARTCYQCLHVSGYDKVSLSICIRIGLGINVYMYQDWVSMYTCIRTGYQCIHVSGLGINVYMYQARTGYQCIHVSG